MSTPARTSPTSGARGWTTGALLSSVIGWGPTTRARRVLMLLVALWLLNGFDLTFTVLAHGQGALNELNPLARIILPYGPLGLTLYKLTAVAFGTAVLWRRRFHPLAELAAWFVLIVYVLVALRWHDLFVLLHYIQQHGAPPGQ